MIGFIARLWRRKWNIARLLVAAFLFWVLAADTAARFARMQLASLPGFDYAAEVRALRLQGRYGEAAVIAQQGRNDLVGAPREQLENEATLAANEQASWIRRAKDVGIGAISGRGTSLESLAGAVAADFFIVGDVRDLVIEGGKFVLDGESDELVLLLSVAGVVTTLAPEIDWAPAVLKAARKAGAVSEKLAGTITSAIKGRRVKELEPIFEDVATISKQASPAGMFRVIKFAQTPEELKTLAKFVDNQPGGAFAIAVTGERGARLVTKEGQAVGELIVLAAKKGRAGADFLGKPAAKALMRPHPLIGLLKGLQKGTLADAARKLMDRIDPAAWWIVPALAGWVFIEATLFVRGMFQRPMKAVRLRVNADSSPRRSRAA
jgi:hypothetical protein